MRSRLVRWFAHPRWPVLLAALAILLTLPALGSGLALDDFILRAKLGGDVPLAAGSSPCMELFRFTPGTLEQNRSVIASGVVPWWADPELKASFFRPLSAATHVLDHRLWPDALALQHLHSLLWYAVGVLLVALLYRRVNGLAAAGLAGLMFAAEDTHYMIAGWLSNRNAAIALAFGAAAIIAHVDWRRRGGAHRLALSLCALAAGLASAEVALGAVAYIAAYQLVMDRAGWRSRLAAMIPHVGLIVAWGAAYVALGFGARGSGLYVDPVREPLQFLLAAAERIPVLLLGQWAQVTVDFWLILPRGVQLGMTAAGAGVLFAVWRLFAPLLRERREARFWALGMALSLIPVCGVFPMDRLLLFPGIGAFGLLACQVEHLGWLDGRSRPAIAAWRRRTLKVLLVVHVILALPQLPVRILAFDRFTGVLTSAARGIPADGAITGQTFVFVNALDMAHIYNPVIRKAAKVPVPRRWIMLSSELTASEIHRLDSRTLRVRPRGGFLRMPGERLFRGVQRPFQAGQRVATADMEVEVSRVTADGRPAEAILRFGLPLEDPRLRWFFVEQGDVKPFRLPAVGQSVTVARGISSLVDIFAAAFR